MWRLAQATPELDRNSPYAYHLICRDFADTSVVAERDGDEGRLCGFVAGYRPPERPDALFVWQVAVAADRRGSGIAGAMLDSVVGPLAERLGVQRVETTVTPQNVASDRLFRSLAQRWNASVRCSPFLSSDDFPVEAGEHDAEILYTLRFAEREVRDPVQTSQRPQPSNCQEHP